MYTLDELNIVGYRGRQVPNSLVRRDEPASHLAILYPGFGYSCDMPLFYYTERLLLSSGADVLRVEYAYNREPGFRELPASGQRDWQRADAAAALDAALGERAYQQITIVGKSIGTRTMGHLLSSDPRLNDATAIWLTPLLNDAELRQQMRQIDGRSLIVIGTADPHFDPAFLDKIAQRDTGTVLTITGGDQLDIDGDVAGSIRAMGQAIGGIGAFISL